MFHDFIALGVLGLLTFAGIILTFFGIGGTFIVLLGAILYDLINWSLRIPINVISWLLVLAVLGEVLEWVITARSAKKASKHAVIGCISGAVIGGIVLSVFPIIGTVIGIFLGAVIGAYLAEYMHTKKPSKAWKAAKAALLGRFLVSLSKFVIVVIQIFIVIQYVHF